MTRVFLTNIPIPCLTQVDHVPSSPAFPFTPPFPPIINLLRPRETPTRISGERFWSRTPSKNIVASPRGPVQPSVPPFCDLVTVGFPYITPVFLLLETLARSSSE
jgi:hypothetical protein